MPLNPKLLRRWIVIAAAALLLAVMGFYSYARYRVRSALKDIPASLGVEIQQSTQGFTFSKSEGGRRIFTISAGKAVRYKTGERAALTDVRIIVYARKADGYDQIYGKEFEYDPGSGDVKANGEVLIDLEARGNPGPDPLATKPGAIRLKTSGLSFNQKTGIAQTSESIEFSIPQASGSAVGALYDSNTAKLTLRSSVRIRTAGDASKQSAVNVNAATITADSAVISDSPRETVLNGVHMEQGSRTLVADEVFVGLRDDSAVHQVIASGEVTVSATGATSTMIRSSRAALDFGGNNALQSALLTGGVTVNATGASPMHGTAGRVLVDFAPKNRIAQVHATESVQFEQGADLSKDNQKPRAQVWAGAMDFIFGNDDKLQRALTFGPSQIALAGHGPTDPSRTVITAGKFAADFASNGRIRMLHGSPNARIVTSNPGQPDRVTTSREVTAQFDPARDSLTGLIQEGDFRYAEGNRNATAEVARYTAATDTLLLTGSPRVDDRDAHIVATARQVRLNRKTGEIFAEGSVKTTHLDPKPSPVGAMFASSDPIHVTAGVLAVAGANSPVRYSGGARLWQGANIVEAPVIVFDRATRTLTAQISEPLRNPGAARVHTVFVKQDKDGKLTPVNITSGKLTYTDGDRAARFEAGVTVTATDATMTADHLQALLKPKSEQRSTTSASQIQRIVAEGKVVVEQKSPHRRAVGDRLVYTADDGKFVLTGGLSDPPSIFDAEHGSVTGDSLTFYSLDDRVQVDSRDDSRTVTRTRIKDEKRR